MFVTLSMFASLLLGYNYWMPSATYIQPDSIDVGYGNTQIKVNTIEYDRSDQAYEEQWVLSVTDESTGTRVNLVEFEWQPVDSQNAFVFYIRNKVTFNATGVFYVYSMNTTTNSDFVQFDFTTLLNEYTLSVPYSLVGNAQDGWFVPIFNFNFIDESMYTKLTDSVNGYDTGYTDGYTNGYKDGNTKGYTDGYRDAQTIYQDGDPKINAIFNGVLSIGLLPVEFFLSIFNFEIFGINITNIVIALLSLGLVIVLLKFLLK